MGRLRFIVILGALMVMGIFGQPTWATMDFEISCEGTRSNGGGTYAYQYTLKNTLRRYNNTASRVLCWH